MGCGSKPSPSADQHLCNLQVYHDWHRFITLHLCWRTASLSVQCLACVYPNVAVKEAAAACCSELQEATPGGILLILPLCPYFSLKIPFFLVFGSLNYTVPN